MSFSEWYNIIKKSENHDFIVDRQNHHSQIFQTKLQITLLDSNHDQWSYIFLTINPYLHCGKSLELT